MDSEKVFSKIDKHGSLTVSILAVLIFIGMLGIAVLSCQLNHMVE